MIDTGSPRPEKRSGGLSRGSFLKLAVLGGGLSVVSLASVLGLRSSVTTTSRSYTESAENFPNPERGWFVSIDPLQNTYDEDGIYLRGNTTMPHEPPPGFEDYALTPEKLAEHRANGISLIRKYYLLYDYRDREIPKSYLDEHPRYDFDLVRESGVKIVPRFIYTWNVLDYEATDAPPSRILAHLDQLAPILRQNADVISHLEIGLVGHYGEWHYSGEEEDVYDHLSHPLSVEWTRPIGIGTTTATYPSGLSESSKEIVGKVLDMLPENRMATLRYLPHVKQMHDEVYGETLTDDNARSGRDISRLGLMDDSFLYDASHRGGYSQPEEKRGLTRNAERAFQRRASRHVVMSGEPSGINPEQPGYFEAADPVAELEDMHWNCMNNAQYESVRDGVYDRWKSDGIYDEIGSRLGYRFILREANSPERVAPGETLELTLDLENTGFAVPHNARPVLVILKNPRTGNVYSIPTEADARDWEAGERGRVVLRGDVPADVRRGEYEISLHFPDPAPTLSDRPEYAVRLASEAGGIPLWNPENGHNDLRITTRISS